MLHAAILFHHGHMSDLMTRVFLARKHNKASVHSDDSHGGVNHDESQTRTHRYNKQASN